MENISAAGQNRRALIITFALTLSYFVVEVVGGLLTNSLALLADAAHMLTDVFGLGLALFATWIAQKPATPEKLTATTGSRFSLRWPTRSCCFSSLFTSCTRRTTGSNLRLK